MKRYIATIDQSGFKVVEDPNGGWVNWEDLDPRESYGKSPADNVLMEMELLTRFQDLAAKRLGYDTRLRAHAELLGIDLNRKPTLWERFIYYAGIREAVSRLRNAWLALRGRRAYY